MLLDDPPEKQHLEFTADFAPPLMDPACAIPAGLVGPHGQAAVKRYNVYRNNIAVSLIDALAAIYPAIQRITGLEFFRALARLHILATPPASPLLFEYGRDFPAFIEGFEHAQDIPWLADTARIERAWLDGYHAADASPLSGELLASVSPDRLGDLMFAPHPATRIVRSPYPAVTIFAANRVDGPVTPVRSREAEDALITRPEMEVTVRRLPPGAAAFLTSLIGGNSLQVAAGAAYDDAPSFDLAAGIAAMVEAGVFTSIKSGD